MNHIDIDIAFQHIYFNFGRQNIENIEIWDQKKNCFINKMFIENKTPENNRWKISLTGKLQFQISYKGLVKIQSSDAIFIAKFFTWLIQQKKQFEKCPFVTDKIVEHIQNQRRLPIQERINNLLQYIKEENEKNSDNKFSKSELKAYSECVNDNEWYIILKKLQQYANIDGNEYTGTITLNVEGLERVESLEINKDSRQAFVAMWFDKSMNDVYEKAIKPAIEELGYQSIRIDRKEHNNKIDDEIIAEIKRSKFLIADFSHGQDGIRGGVYYEAGFAHGLGIPVIFTCREENKDDLHFDTRQFNHILWENPEDLKKSLKDRIGATLGDGPFKPNDPQNQT